MSPTSYQTAPPRVACIRLPRVHRLAKRGRYPPGVRFRRRRRTSTELVVAPRFERALVAIEDTLKQALDDLFGAAPPTLEQLPAAPSAPGAPAPAPSTNATVQQLLQQANDAFAAAQAALAKGDLGTYQAKINEAADLVRRARDAAGGQPAGTTTTTPVASALGPPPSRAGQPS